MANFKGSAKPDTIWGTMGADRIQGLGGNDRLYGLAGDDLLEGGNGDDLLQPGAGADTIDGGGGRDTLDYSDRTTGIRLTPTNDTQQEYGRGQVEEYDSALTLVSTDIFSGIENATGGSGNDYIYMDWTNNVARGGAGDDYLYGGSGDDQLYGGDGDDLISADGGWDLIDGGSGFDTLFWPHGAPSRVIVDLAAGTITYPDYPGGADTLVSIENVRGYYGTKEIYGTDGTNVIQGSTGGDLIDGRGGNDILVGDFGRDIGATNAPVGYDDDIRGGAGDDLLSGDLGSDILTGGSGADVFVVDSYYGTDRITDFEDGVDRLALYGGLTIAAWEGRDTNDDGVIDAQAAILSNGEAILFEGFTAAPSSLIPGGTGLVLHSDPFAIPDLAHWTMAGGEPWDAAMPAAIYAAACGEVF